jgi:hypothetical protein
MNYPNRDWKLPLPSSLFEDASDEPAPLPTPPANPRALQVVHTPTELTNPPPPSPLSLELAESPAAARRGELFRWVVLVTLTIANMLLTLMVAARR